MVLYGTVVVMEKMNGHSIDVKARPERQRRNRGARAPPLGRLCGVHEERLRKDQHARDRDARAGFQKRELYALVGNKQEMLIACIGERAKRLEVPADLPLLRDRETLAQVLTSFSGRSSSAR